MAVKWVRHRLVVESNRAAGLISIGDVVKVTISEKRFIIKQLELYGRATCNALHAVSQA